MKGRTIYVIIYLLIALSSCNKDDYGMRPVPEDTEAVITVRLNTDHVEGVPLDDIHLFCFDRTDHLTGYHYYDSMQELALAHFVLPAGNYTMLAVLNAGADLMPSIACNDLSDISFSSVAEWIKAQADAHPDMLTGTLRYTVKKGEQQVHIDLASGDKGVKLTNMELFLTLPSPHLPDYSPTRSSVLALRCVAEIYKQGTTERITTQRAMLAATEDKDTYRFDLALWMGEYDICLWVDYTTDDEADNHYITTSLNPVKILSSESYMGNTDTRDAFAGSLSFKMAGDYATENVTLCRPLARYRLVTTDVSEYNELRDEKGWPALEDLTIKVTYDGFWPNAYSVPNAAPAGATGGYGYVSAFSEQSRTEATIGKDYVFVNGTESFVVVTVTFYDTGGKIVNQARNLQVNYRVGHLTTVQGNFLTVGAGGGIQIDTEWSGEYEVCF